jgi:hypothetical protein
VQVPFCDTAVAKSIITWQQHPTRFPLNCQLLVNSSLALMTVCNFNLINIVSWWCWTTNHAANSDWKIPLKLITHEDVSTLPLWWIRGAKTGLYTGKKMQTGRLISALFPAYAILEWEWEERSSFFTFFSTYVCMCLHHRVTKTDRDDTARLLREYTGI